MCSLDLVSSILSAKQWNDKRRRSQAITWNRRAVKYVAELPVSNFSTKNSATFGRPDKSFRLNSRGCSARMRVCVCVCVRLYEEKSKEEDWRDRHTVLQPPSATLSFLFHRHKEPSLYIPDNMDAAGDASAARFE